MHVWPPRAQAYEGRGGGCKAAAPPPPSPPPPPGFFNWRYFRGKTSNIQAKPLAFLIVLYVCFPNANCYVYLYTNIIVLCVWYLIGHGGIFVSMVKKSAQVFRPPPHPLLARRVFEVWRAREDIRVKDLPPPPQWSWSLAPTCAPDSLRHVLLLKKQFVGDMKTLTHWEHLYKNVCKKIKYKEAAQQIEIIWAYALKLQCFNTESYLLLWCSYKKLSS